MSDTVVWSISINGLHMVMTTDHSKSLSVAKIRNVEISYELDKLPTMTMTYIDMSGVLLSDFHYTPEQRYTLMYGHTQTDIVSTEWSYYSSTSDLLSSGRPEALNTTTVFSHKHWHELSVKEKSRSWEDTPSNVIKNILDKKSTTTIESIGDKQVILQPMKPDMWMINWLCRKEGILWYMDPLESKGISIHSATNQDSYMTYVLSETNIDEEDTRDCKNLKILTPYAQAAKTFGGKMYRYNPFKKEYVTQQLMPDVALSDTIYLTGEHIKRDAILNAGRNQNTHEFTNKVNRQSLETTKIQIDINGDMEIKPGMVITLIIPATEEQGTVLATYYSGKWIVKKVTHALSFGKQVQYVTRLVLMRGGIDLKEVGDLYHV